MDKKNLTTLIVAIIIAGVAGFFGGLKYGQTKTSAAGNRPGAANFQNRQFGGAAQGMRNRGGQGGGFVNGDIIKKDDSSITVKLPDGGSKIVFLNASSTILKSTTGSAADLVTGKTVSINGTTNTDGSIAAQTIQLRDRPFGAPGERNPSGNPSSTGQVK